MNIFWELFDSLVYLVWVGISGLIEFIWMLVRLPVRWLSCNRKGHEWKWLGNGFFGMFAPRKPFKCLKCGFKTASPQEYKTVKHQLEE